MLPDLLDELLDLKGEEQPKQSLREKEESVREQVQRAVRELEEKSRQEKEAAPAAAPPPPPNPETKPWRTRFWGD